jgi:hypothetical protein
LGMPVTADISRSVRPFLHLRFISCFLVGVSTLVLLATIFTLLGLY